AERVAPCLPAAGLRVKIIALPGLPPKADVSDYLEQHTKDELFATIQATADWQPGAAPAIEVTDRDGLAQLEDVTLDLTAERLIEPVPFPEEAKIGLPHVFASLYEGRSDAPYPFLYMSYLTVAAAAMSPFVRGGSRYSPGRVGSNTVLVGSSSVGRKSFRRGQAIAHFTGLDSPWCSHLHIPDA